MGTIKTKGSAVRYVDYDRTEVMIRFRERKSSGPMALKFVQNSCNGFLTRLKENGFDPASFRLKSEEVHAPGEYGNRRDSLYTAVLSIAITYPFDARVTQWLTEQVNALKSDPELTVSNELSDENTIRQELLQEAVEDARARAEVMSSMLHQKIVGIKNAQTDPVFDQDWGAPVAVMADAAPDAVEFEQLAQLKPDQTKLSAEVYITWKLSDVNSASNPD